MFLNNSRCKTSAAVSPIIGPVIPGLAIGELQWVTEQTQLQRPTVIKIKALVVCMQILQLASIAKNGFVYV